MRRSAAFSLDGARVVTASAGIARIWNTELDKGTLEDWSALAARSPFALNGNVHVRRTTPDH
jgi:hypothetical protein